MADRRDPDQVRCLLGFGLDNEDGHTRLTRGEDYVLVVTAAETKVAMVLIEADAVFMNEEARAHLRSLWGEQYEANMKQMIPEFASSLAADELPVSAFRIASHGEA